MQKLAVLISGSGSNLQAIIDAVDTGIIKDGIVTIVVSNRSDAYGLERAKKHNIPTAVFRKKDFESQMDYEQAMISLLDENACDLVILAGFTAILSPHFINHFENRILNIHPSLIPAFCGEGFYGLKVHEAAITAGVKVSGATVHMVNEICDGGKILAQDTVPVFDEDTPEILQSRILENVEHKLYPKVIQAICHQRGEERA